MTRSAIKWGVLAVVVVVAAAALFSKKTFLAETTIPAPPDAVWSVLMDTAEYANWNPVFVAIEGAYASGAQLTNHVRFPDGSVVAMDATVETMVPSRELRQKGGMPGILTFDHRWLLEPVLDGTEVTQLEVDRGLWLWFWDSDWVEPAYRRTNEALGARVLGTDG